MATEEMFDILNGLLKTEEIIETTTNLLNVYCPLGDSIPFMSWFLIYLRGANHFHHRCHFSATGPDDFANNQLGKIIEAISPNPSVMTFSDAFLRSGTNKVKEAGPMIIYLDKKPRHNEEYERLCQHMRDRYFNNGQAVVVIIGNSEFVDRKLKRPTIHVHVPPFTTYVPPFLLPNAEEELKKIRELIDDFWEKHLSNILDCSKDFPRIDWLKNQDEQSWLPILAPLKVYSDLLGYPIYFENMLALAKKMVTSRKMEEDAISLEQKVLEATLTFVERTSHETIKNQEGTEFYLGPDLCEFIRKMTDLPQLRKEKISKILNDHDGVVVGTWRPRIEVDDEKASRKDKQVKKIIQPTCYAINQERLAEALRNYRKSG